MIFTEALETICSRVNVVLVMFNFCTIHETVGKSPLTDDTFRLRRVVSIRYETVLEKRFRVRPHCW